jgi:putative ABC transport system permease protein
MHAVLPDATYTDPEARRRFVENTTEALSALPGVTGVGISNVIPTSGGNAGRWIEVEGQPAPDPANRPAIDYRTVTPSFMQTMQLPMLRGRGITPADTADSLPVIIISDSAARRFFGDADPIGKRIRLGGSDTPWLTIVGISGDYIHNWFGRRNAPTAYRPYAQAPALGLSFVIRANGDLAALMGPAREAIRRVDPAQPVFDLMTVNDALAERTIGLQYVAAIMAVFGGLALLIAAVGVYSLMAFIVAQRTHEIGVRIALGATAGGVVRQILRESLRVVAIGAAVGWVIALLVAMHVRGGVVNATIFVGVPVVLMLVAAAACWVPARRAARVDPVVALRATD